MENDAGLQETATDVVVEVAFGATEAFVSAKTASIVGAKVGTMVAPGVGSLIGAIAGAIAGIAFNFITENVEANGVSFKELIDNAIDWAIDGIKSWFN